MEIRGYQLHLPSLGLVADAIHLTTAGNWSSCRPKQLQPSQPHSCNCVHCLVAETWFTGLCSMPCELQPLIHGRTIYSTKQTIPALSEGRAPPFPCVRHVARPHESVRTPLLPVLACLLRIHSLRSDFIRLTIPGPVTSHTGNRTRTTRHSATGMVPQVPGPTASAVAAPHRAACSSRPTRTAAAFYLRERTMSTTETR